MKILAIDTTGNTCSVAVLDKDKVICETSTNHIKNHSQSVMPMIDYCLTNIDCRIKDMDYIACSSGPGSFTGLRIGAATAKGLAHGAGKTIINVPTLDALAYNVFDETRIIVPIMDARRNQVYTGFYKMEDGLLTQKHEYMAEDINIVLDKLQGQPAIFTGDGVLIYRDIIEEKGHVAAPVHMLMQRAASVGALAFKMASEQSNIEGYGIFTPVYLRKPQAQRELEERGGSLAPN
jgi:tRNA threonylcarbamoyladenosine biosynthesis protein TsaB